MTLSSTSSSSSIFRDGKLIPGVYKIQNLYAETYLDVHLHSMELCCRPAKDLEGKRGFWRIARLGDGYAMWRVDPGNPYQFCSPIKGLSNGDPVCTTAYPTAWRVERVKGEIYCRFEYVRFHFGPTEMVWDLWVGSKENGASVKFHILNAETWQMWKLIPVEVEGVDCPLQSPDTFGSGLPPYDPNEPEQSSTRQQHVESDDFGTVVTEVTIVTTRKKYRPVDP